MVMDEKDFKKHLHDLVHGHYHPEEHDWAPGTDVKKTNQRVNAKRGTSAKSVVRKVKRRAK
jgi:hypothetical protein